MSKDYLIKIKGVQKYQGEGDADVIELLSLGKFVKKGDSYYISYQETDATGFAGTTTTLKIENDPKVTMMRSHGGYTHLIIEKNKRHLCQYSTGHGNLMIGVSAGDIRCDLNEQGGDVYFKYALDINSSLTSENEIFIHVKECKNRDV